jgi:hypothetical protein
MAKVWRLMGHYNAESQSYSACAGTLQTSPWTSDFNGRLTGLRTQVSDEAATSLVEHVQFKLTCAAWRPNSLEVFACGKGLATAPAVMNESRDFAVDQPIIAGTPVTVEARNDVATAVTNSTFIYGQFEVGG